MIKQHVPTLAIIAALSVLGGCSSARLSGIYGDRAINGSALSFKDDGTLSWQTGDGMSEHAKYKVHGTSVDLIEMHDGKWTTTHTLQIDDKGCLTGDILDGAACKKQSPA